VTAPQHRYVRFIETAAIALPFLAVGLGLMLLHSAWTAILIYNVGIVLLLAWSGPGDLLRLVRSGARPGAVAGLVLLGTVAGPALVIAWTIAGGDGEALAGGLSGVGLEGARLVGFLVWLSMVHPVLEELSWRGLLLTRERHPCARDAAFAAYHVPVMAMYAGVPIAAISFVVLLGVAWLWRTVAIRTGGLAAPVLGHLAANTSVSLAIWWIVR